MKKIVTILILLFGINTFAQVDKNEALANHYFSTGKFEKAAVLLEDLYNSKTNSRRYYSMLFTTLLRLNEYDKLEKIVKKQIRKNKGEKTFEVELAYVYSQNNQVEKAKALNEKIIKSLTADEQEIRGVAYKYTSLRQSEYLLQTYEKGNKLFKNKNKFAYEMAEALFSLNKLDKAVAYWLSFLESNPNRVINIQSVFSRNLNKEGFQDVIEEQLYIKIQEKPNTKLFPELLIWLFTNQKDFESAMIQAKALDKKLKEAGERIMILSQNAMQEKQYKSAIIGYDYILQKGENNGYFRMAKSGILKARKQQILHSNDFTNEDLLALKQDYTDYLETYGKSLSNAKTIRELANLEAKYLNNVDEGILLIEELLQNTSLKKKLKNKLKLDLGDMYMLKGDVWESVLIYAQVDKDEKDSPLGEDARFRNAKLSYYIGEFEWAKAQLLVLKGATTELIANDALDLSIFIIDNLGLDTSSTAIKMFSEAELLLIQNKKNEAISKLNDILKLFPEHVLTDDILLKKAEIYLSKNEYTETEKVLLQLLKDYNEDILGDNATFMLAELYDYKLNDKQNAKAFYEKIIMDYSDSVLLVNARKRYRKLRGDSH